MNLIETFQNLMAQLPEFLQPLVVALAGAVPFVEGEGAAAIGILGGIHPVVAMIAGAIGNFVCVAVLVLLASRARVAVVTRHRERMLANGGGEGEVSTLDDEPTTPRQAKFKRAFERYGLPGVCLLGPLLLPTQFTATMLAGAGIDRTRILIWQGVAIVLWTTVIGSFVGGVLHFAG